jgi:hypothetical protein
VACVLGAVYKIGTAPKDTPLGHLVHSAYDYVISKSLGFHVDYDQSLGQQYERLKRSENNQWIPILGQHRFDSAIEKCNGAISGMHRPIVNSKTAEKALILGRDGRPIGPKLNSNTYEYIKYKKTSEESEIAKGRVSSYNINTFKGRIYVPQEGRPISFVLSENARCTRSIKSVMNNLNYNAINRSRQDTQDSPEIGFRVFKNTSRSGVLKSFYVTEVL